jgi:hypothetical protein
MEAEEITVMYDRGSQAPTPVETMSAKETDSETSTVDVNRQVQRSQQRGVDSHEVVLKENLIHAFRLNRKKQLTLERINKYNAKLMEELKTPRVKASNCALMVINYTEQTEDPLIPEIWGYPKTNLFKQANVKIPQLLSKNDHQTSYQLSNNQGHTSEDGCCVIM